MFAFSERMLNMKAFPAIHQRCDMTFKGISDKHSRRAERARCYLRMHVVLTNVLFMFSCNLALTNLLNLPRSSL